MLIDDMFYFSYIKMHDCGDNTIFMCTWEFLINIAPLECVQTCVSFYENSFTNNS